MKKYEIIFSTGLKVQVEADDLTETERGIYFYKDIQFVAYAPLETVVVLIDAFEDAEGSKDIRVLTGF